MCPLRSARKPKSAAAEYAVSETTNDRVRWPFYVRARSCNLPTSTPSLQGTPVELLNRIALIVTPKRRFLEWVNRLPDAGKPLTIEEAASSSG